MFTGLVLSLTESEELNGRFFTDVLAGTAEENFNHKI